MSTHFPVHSIYEIILRCFCINTRQCPYYCRYFFPTVDQLVLINLYCNGHCVNRLVSRAPPILIACYNEYFSFVRVICRQALQVTYSICLTWNTRTTIVINLLCQQLHTCTYLSLPTHIIGIHVSVCICCVHI